MVTVDMNSFLKIIRVYIFFKHALDRNFVLSILIYHRNVFQFK